jgi:predicted Zn finger-like uncharacterized protein
VTCPECSSKVYVVDSVNTPDNKILRKRKCVLCGHIFYTSESEAAKDVNFKYEWNANYRQN